MWQGTFSAEEHYHHHIRTLQSTIVNPEDWVIVADSDEFQAWDQQIP